MAFTDPLQYLGAATALFLTLKVVHFATPYLTPSKLHRYRHDGNSWALVTGSTSGIGEGFAHALANKKFNLLLHGRNQNKLDKLVKELNTQYPDVQVKTVIADVSDVDVDVSAITFGLRMHASSIHNYFCCQRWTLNTLMLKFASVGVESAAAPGTVFRCIPLRDEGRVSNKLA